MGSPSLFCYSKKTLIDAAIVVLKCSNDAQCLHFAAIGDQLRLYAPAYANLHLLSPQAAHVKVLFNF